MLRVSFSNYKQLRNVVNLKYPLFLCIIGVVDMVLVIFKREDKALYRKCLNCPYFIELKDDPKQYPKTVGVVCGADSEIVAKCFTYMWMLACGHPKKRTVIKKEPELVPQVKQNQEIRKVLENLRKLRR